MSDLLSNRGMLGSAGNMAINAFGQAQSAAGQVSLAQLNNAATNSAKVNNGYASKQYVPAVLTGMMSHMESRLMDPDSMAVIVWDVAEAVAKEGSKRGY